MPRLTGPGGNDKDGRDYDQQDSTHGTPLAREFSALAGSAGGESPATGNFSSDSYDKAAEFGGLAAGLLGLGLRIAGV